MAIVEVVLFSPNVTVDPDNVTMAFPTEELEKLSFHD